MRHRTFRGSAVLAVVVLMTSATIALADTIPADGDFALVGNQKTITLPQAAPGQVVVRSVRFYLTCNSSSHPAPGTTIQLDQGAVSAPTGGAVSATSATIGPVPEGWPTGGACQDPLQTLASNSPSDVTMTMPTTPGTYTFDVMWNRSTTAGLTGTTAISFNVKVVGNAPPQMSVPSDMSVEATGPTGASATFTATATDPEDGTLPTPTCTPASGSTFPIAQTTVTCTATDGGGLSASGSFHVTVEDTTAPALVLPADQTAEATSGAGASVSFTTSATDVVDGPLSVNCDHASGDTFPVGTTTVACSATDTAGNPTTGSFHVTVQDTTAPLLVLPLDKTAEATGAAGASVLFATAASDVVDGLMSVNCDHASGDTFPLGTTTVACSTTDTAGNPTTGSFHVTVQDTTAPTLVGMPANLTRTTANGSGTTLTYAAPTATDAVDPAPTIGCTPASGSTIPLGTTTVTCTATDAAGNPASASFTAAVTYVPPSTIWTATWGEPVASSGDTFVGNFGRTIPIKVSIFVNGVEQRSGHGASLAVVACGGGTPVVTGLDWDGGRWAGHLDTGRLAGPGCYLATASLDGHDAGFIEIDLRGASSSAKTNANHAH